MEYQDGPRSLPGHAPAGSAQRPRKPNFQTSGCSITKFQTRREAKAALFEYIEIFYNRQRRHSSIGYRTPAQARMDMMPKMAA